MKPGGYSDSGADIAYELYKNGMAICTPSENPNRDSDTHWVFPDTKSGIESALQNGANTFWLNTVLYKNHPIEGFFDKEILWVGQDPRSVDLYDDKLHTNRLLKSRGIPIPETVLIEKRNVKSTLRKMEVPLDFPLVLKPRRGRGSQGVFLVHNWQELDQRSRELFDKEEYGNALYLEHYLSGQEITITVMPPGNYRIKNRSNRFDRPWCLPAVKRYNHQNGIAPYNGVVAVMNNSALLDDGELDSDEIQEVNLHCVKAAASINIKAPIRIDCRADKNGKYHLFDLNMKPNMTGPSRPLRTNQDSLTLMAARKMGWNYFDLLTNMLNQKWKADS